MKKNYKHIVLSAIVLCFSSTSFAGTVKSCESRNTYDDYGDAPKSYGVACNDTAKWQTLGQMTTAEQQAEDNRINGGTGSATGYRNSNAYKTYSQESNQKNTDTGDNGVVWRIKGTDEWGNDQIHQGDEVEFKFSVWRSQTGTHEYDRLKSWIDWNGSGNFDNGSNSDEILIEKDWALNHDANDNVDTTPNTKLNTDLSTYRREWKWTRYGWKKRKVWTNKVYNSDDLFREYTVTTKVPLDAVIGDTWMRARLVCENSVTSHSVGGNLLPWGYQDQGETEDYKITIAKKRPERPTEVPEPASLGLMLSAFLLIGLRRKLRK